jgi:hypothetical protein
MSKFDAIKTLERTAQLADLAGDWYLHEIELGVYNGDNTQREWRQLPIMSAFVLSPSKSPDEGLSLSIALTALTAHGYDYANSDTHDGLESIRQRLKAMPEDARTNTKALIQNIAAIELYHKYAGKNGHRELSWNGDKLPAAETICCAALAESLSIPARDQAEVARQLQAANEKITPASLRSVQ